jgi:hypothetical protein
MPCRWEVWKGRIGVRRGSEGHHPKGSASTLPMGKAREKRLQRKERQVVECDHPKGLANALPMGKPRKKREAARSSQRLGQCLASGPE